MKATIVKDTNSFGDLSVTVYMPNGDVHRFIYQEGTHHYLADDLKEIGAL